MDDVRWSEVKLLRANDWWDGMLSASAEIRGKRYWLECCDGTECDDWRTFAIHDLTEAGWRLRDEMDRLFEESVGGHMNYDANGRQRRAGPRQPREHWDRWYQREDKDREGDFKIGMKKVGEVVQTAEAYAPACRDEEAR